MFTVQVQVGPRWRSVGAHETLEEAVTSVESAHANSGLHYRVLDDQAVVVHQTA